MLFAPVRQPERTSEHVSKSVSMQHVEQLNSSALGKGQLAKSVIKGETTLVFLSSINDLFVRLLFIWFFFLSFVLDACPKGCKCCRIPQDFGTF